jgi:hypothetical protein
MKYYYLIVFSLLIGTANSRVSLGATNASIVIGGPDFDLISETYEKSGLYDRCNSGFTDFDAYMASNPIHISDYNGNEWFSREYDTPQGVATVTYDLGFRINIDALALWIGESSGIGFLNLFGSLDGLNFISIAYGLTPQDNPHGETRPNNEFP